MYIFKFWAVQVHERHRCKLVGTHDTWHSSQKYLHAATSLSPGRIGLSPSLPSPTIIRGAKAQCKVNTILPFLQMPIVCFIKDSQYRHSASNWVSVKSILSFPPPHLQTVDIAFISKLMFFFYSGDFSTDVVIAHHTAGPVMMFLSMSLHFPDGPEIQSTIHLKTKHFMGCFLALSESSVSASLILMLSVSLLSEEDSLNIIFRMRCDLLLFCVSSGKTCLVNVVFLYFYRLLRLFSCLDNWRAPGSLWKRGFVSVFHCDFPSLGTSWIKMSPLVLTEPTFLLFSFRVIFHHHGSQISRIMIYTMNKWTEQLTASSVFPRSIRGFDSTQCHCRIKYVCKGIFEKDFVVSRWQLLWRINNEQPCP